MKSHLKIGAVASCFVLLSTTGCSLLPGGSSNNDSESVLGDLDDRLVMNQVSQDGEYDFCNETFLDGILDSIPVAEGAVDVDFHSAMGGHCIQSGSVESSRETISPNRFTLEIRVQSVASMIERQHGYDYDWSSSDHPLGMQGGESECSLVDKAWPSDFPHPDEDGTGIDHQVADGEVCLMIPDHIEPTVSTAYVREGHFVLATFATSTTNKINVNPYGAEHTQFHRQMVPSLSAAYSFFTGERLRNFEDVERKETPDVIQEICHRADEALTSAVGASPRSQYLYQPGIQPWEEACIVSAQGQPGEDIPVDEAHADEDALLSFRVTWKPSGSGLDNSCYERGASSHLSPALQPTETEHGELCLNGNEYRDGASTYLIGAWQDEGFIGHFSLKVRENFGEDADSDFAGNWDVNRQLVDEIFQAQ